MIVRVRLFATARQLAGRQQLEITVPDRANIGDLRARLGEEVPAIAGSVNRFAFAIGARYAGDCEEIPPGADVACIPPVSGG